MLPYYNYYLHAKKSQLEPYVKHMYFTFIKNL